MAYERKTTDIYVSNELKSVLNQIKDHSLVARLLLKPRLPKNIIKDDHVNWISISKTDKNKISYLSKDREQKIIDEDKWNNKLRYVSKPGSFVAKIFKDMSNSEIEKFSNYFISYQNGENYEFKIVEGEEIKKWYLERNYHNNCSSLGASCMRYTGCQKFMDIYENNPEVVKMLIMINNDGKLLGRSLLWYSEDLKIMDRVYTVNDNRLLSLFHSWASSNGYIYKAKQNWNDSLHFEVNGKKNILKIDLKLKDFNFKYYPYLDTFKFLGDDGILRNYQPDNISTKTLCFTDGEYSYDRYLEVCEISNIYYRYDEITYLNYLNKKVNKNNCRYSHLYNCWILREDSILIDGNWIFKDEEINLEYRKLLGLPDVEEKKTIELGSFVVSFINV